MRNEGYRRFHPDYRGSLADRVSVYADEEGLMRVYDDNEGPVVIAGRWDWLIAVIVRWLR